LRWPAPGVPLSNDVGTGWQLEALEGNEEDPSSSLPTPRMEDPERTQDSDVNRIYPLAEDTLEPITTFGMVAAPRAAGNRQQRAYRPQDTADSSDNTLWPASKNSNSTSSSGIVTESSEMVQTVGTSLSLLPQSLASPEAKVCRCKRHTDICERAQYTTRAEFCQGCRGFFSWSARATPFIIYNEHTSHKLCRCDWHNADCRNFRDEFDAGKCKCCLGWMTFSDRADLLILSPKKQARAEIHDDHDFSDIMNWDTAA
jgi:hypothetical protein